MGNYSSSSKQNSSKTNMAKLVDSQGQLRLAKLPITVAELMLENPGFAISQAEELRRTRRISAMKADECLLGRKVYLLVPVDKVNVRLSDMQVAAIDSIICSCDNKRTKKMTRGSSKISPDVVTCENFGYLVKDLGGHSSNGRACQRKRLDRAWAPVLEPILEGC